MLEGIIITAEHHRQEGKSAFAALKMAPMNIYKKPLFV